MDSKNLIDLFEIIFYKIGNNFFALLLNEINVLDTVKIVDVFFIFSLHHKVLKFQSNKIFVRECT